MSNLTLFSGTEVTVQDQQEKVQRLEDFLLQLPQADIKTEHTFKPGIYERTITIPPWTILTGAPHKTDYIVRHEKGKTTFTTDDGVKTLEAPSTFQAKKGTKRAGYSYEEEVVWTDIYENLDDCTDLDILESRLYIIPSCGLGENRKKLVNSQQQILDLGEA